MNKSFRLAAAINSQVNHFQLRSSNFHSTTVLERRRRTHWDSESSFRSSPRKFNQYSKRLKKENLLRNVSQFAEDIFQSWKTDRVPFEQPHSSRGSSWFRVSRPSFSGSNYKPGKQRSRTSRASRREFEFCDSFDDAEVGFEKIWSSAFGGGNRHFYWSFTMDDESPYMTYSNHSKYSSGWKHRYENYDDDEDYDDKYDSSSYYKKPVADSTSNRLALGLSASGPLHLEDVKKAYRTCALKWHPDRHPGASKAMAEEKFKVCSVAYQSLCDKLALH